ncbi:MAG: hypothetical protein GC193_10705 [Cryomorphaceae bacterium]|nr:hypothetical protein [Cryomorphaceae bacterium]
MTVEEPGNGILECWRLDTSEDFLRKLFEDIFVNNWHQIQYGILIQGGVLEFEPPCAPTKFGYLDGYLTVEFGEFGHMHLCVGWNTGYCCSKTNEAIARLRLPSRVELYRKLNLHGEPTFWGLRTFNSREPEPEQTLHIYLPNPLLTEEMDYADPPEWSKLSLWDHLRKHYLGIEEPDPKDRMANRFSHD